MDVKAEAERLRDQGRTYREIGATLGFSESQAWKVLNPYGIHRQRERALGRRLVARECAAPGCCVVIAASARANRIYCSARCKSRAMNVKQIVGA